MTNEQILEKAIERAQSNGYIYEIEPRDWVLKHQYYEIIFSHPFAKAFWGKDYTGTGNWSMHREPHTLNQSYSSEDKEIAWKFHLRQMVLESEPLLYLEKFLKDNGKS